MSKTNTIDPSMANVRTRYKESEMTLHELGVAMGYPESSARKSAWQFLEKTDDPHVSMLRRFAQAMGISVKTLL